MSVTFDPFLSAKLSLTSTAGTLDLLGSPPQKTEGVYCEVYVPGKWSKKGMFDVFASLTCCNGRGFQQQGHGSMLLTLLTR